MRRPAAQRRAGNPFLHTEQSAFHNAGAEESRAHRSRLIATVKKFRHRITEGIDFRESASQSRAPMSMPTPASFIQPYLFFGGRCEEAVEFYRNALGAEVQMLMRYNESPEPHPPGMMPSGWEEKIMHASLKIGDTTLMASDGCSESKFDGFSLSFSVPNESEADRVFAALADGGEVRMPLSKTFWSP